MIEKLKEDIQEALSIIPTIQPIYKRVSSTGFSLTSPTTGFGYFVDYIIKSSHTRFCIKKREFVRHTTDERLYTNMVRNIKQDLYSALDARHEYSHTIWKKQLQQFLNFNYVNSDLYEVWKYVKENDMGTKKHYMNYVNILKYLQLKGLKCE